MVAAPQTPSQTLNSVQVEIEIDAPRYSAPRRFLRARMKRLRKFKKKLKATYRRHLKEWRAAAYRRKPILERTILFESHRGSAPSECAAVRSYWTSNGHIEPRKLDPNHPAHH